MSEITSDRRSEPRVSDGREYWLILRDGYPDDPNRFSVVGVYRTHDDATYAEQMVREGMVGTGPTLKIVPMPLRLERPEGIGDSRRRDVSAMSMREG